MAKKLDYKIDMRIFDNLVDIQKSLPDRARTSTPEEGLADPAGLALLGVKDGVLDKISPLKATNGCWDLPGITYEDMDKSFRKLLKESYTCIGMALVRNLRWSSRHRYDSQKEGIISRDLKYHIQHFKNSFDDIEKTVWITLDGEYFRTYRVYKDKNNNRKFNVRETKAKTIYQNDSKKKFLKGKFDKEKSRKLERKKKREEEERREQEHLEELKRREEEIKEERKNKQQKIDKEIKEKKKDKIDLGNGQYLLKNKYEKYILWQA